MRTFLKGKIAIKVDPQERKAKYFSLKKLSNEEEISPLLKPQSPDFGVNRKQQFTKLKLERTHKRSSTLGRKYLDTLKVSLGCSI